MSTVPSIAPRTVRRETLICLHSSGSTGRQWVPIAQALSAHCHVLTPDLLGYPGTHAWPIDAPTSLDDEATALAPLLNDGGVHLFGHSYGGSVALQIALRWPDRVKSLTLYEPVRFALLFRQPATAAAGDAIVKVGRQIGVEVQAGMPQAAAARFVDYWSGDGTWQRMQPRHQQTLATRMSKVRAEFEALFADRVPASAFGALPMPVHLMGGTRSPAPARLVLDILAENCRQATRTVLVGLGHMGPVDAPQRVLDALGGSIPIPALAHAA